MDKNNSNNNDHSNSDSTAIQTYSESKKNNDAIILIEISFYILQYNDYQYQNFSKS